MPTSQSRRDLTLVASTSTNPRPGRVDPGRLRTLMNTSPQASSSMAASIVTPNSPNKASLHHLHQRWGTRNGNRLPDTEHITSSRSSRAWIMSSPTPGSPLYVVVLCMLANFFVEVGDYLMRAPATHAMEGIVCQQYWDSHDPGRFVGSIDEKWCKVEPVQTELAMLRG